MSTVNCFVHSCDLHICPMTWFWYKVTNHLLSIFLFCDFSKKTDEKNTTTVIKISFTKKIICFLAKLRPLHPHMLYIFGRLLICPSTCNHLKEEVQTIFFPAKMDCDEAKFH